MYGEKWKMKVLRIFKFDFRESLPSARHAVPRV
jgi:hypothetical protein